MTIRVSVALARVFCACIFSALTTATTPRVVTSGAVSVEAQSSVHFANADDPAKVAAGRLIYARRCSSCHGKRLQGQPLWQLQDRYSGRRAPAHDESGHTWGHSDEDLF